MNGKIGFCEWVFLHAGPTSVKLAAELGANCLQVDDLGGRARCYPLSDRRFQQEYLELAAQHGVELVSVGLNAAGKSGELVKDIDGPEGDGVKETLRRSVTACADMGMSLLMLPFFWRSFLKEEDTEKIKNAEKLLKYAARVGEEHGVTVTIESTLSADTTVSLLSAVQSDRVKVFYDTQNTRYFCGADSLAEIRQYGELIAQVHMKDGSPELLGELPIGGGEARCRDAVAALKEIGYAGPLLIETHYDRILLRDPAFDLYAQARQDLLSTARLLSDVR